MDTVNIATDQGRSVDFIVSKASAVTPSDTDTFDYGLLYVGVTGDVKARPVGQTGYVTFKGVPAGSFLPVYIIGVHTDTTATDMLICY
jgi:hypothetical protein